MRVTLLIAALFVFVGMAAAQGTDTVKVLPHVLELASDVEVAGRLFLLNDAPFERSYHIDVGSFGALARLEATDFALSPGEHRELALAAWMDLSNATEGDSRNGTVTFTVTSADGFYSFVKQTLVMPSVPPRLGIPAGPPEEPAFVEPPKLSTSRYQFQPLTENISITNPWATTKTYSIDILGPPEAKVKAEPTRATLGPGETIRVSITSPPPASPSRSYVGTIRVHEEGAAPVAVFTRVPFNFTVTSIPCCQGGPVTPVAPSMGNPTVTRLRLEGHDVIIVPETNYHGSVGLFIWNDDDRDATTRLNYTFEGEGASDLRLIWHDPGATLDLVVPAGDRIVVRATVRGGPYLAPATLVFTTSDGGRVELPVRYDAAATDVAPKPVQGYAGAATIAATVGTVALGAVLVHRRFPLVFAALYSRLAPSRVLAHPARQRLRDLIAAEPGIGVNDAMRQTGMTHGAFHHHLQRLEATGHVLSIEDGQKRALYLAGAAVPQGSAPADERLLEALAEAGGRASAAELAKGLGISRQLLHYHLRRLERAGRLRLERQGREVYAHLPPE